MELALIEKRQNEANWYRPQILCPQRVNVGWIRPSLCKTNPIPGVRTGHRRATHSGSRHSDKLCPSRPGSSKCQVTGPGGGTGRYRAKAFENAYRPKPFACASGLLQATSPASFTSSTAFARVSSGCRSAVGVRVELRQRDLLVEHKLRKDEPARGDLKGQHEREVSLAGIVQGAAGDFRHRHLTRVVGNDGGHVVARQANPDH